MTLAQLPVGKEGVIETVGGEGNLRCRFLDMGVITIRKEDGEKIVLKEGSVQ